MPGNKEGGKKAAERNKLLYGDDFYRTIGRMGGEVKGLNAPFRDREFASKQGRMGGLASGKARNVRKQITEGLEDYELNYQEINEGRNA